MTLCAELADSEPGGVASIGVHALPQGRRIRWPLWVSTVAFGLACASKPTAWFLAPFYAMLLVYDHLDAARCHLGKSVCGPYPPCCDAVGPPCVTFPVLVGPWLLWNPAALYDDVWRWSSGQGETGYQIWGWGASNFVLGLRAGCRTASTQWPFWITEAAHHAPAAAMVHPPPAARSVALQRVLALRRAAVRLLLRQPLPKRELPGLHPRLPGHRHLQRLAGFGAESHTNSKRITAAGNTGNRHSLFFRI